jgi:hypothetical protein
MNPLKVKLLEGILGHLDESQGMDLKALLEAQKEKEVPVMPEDKGIAVEKVSVMAKPEGEEEAMGKAGMDEVEETPPEMSEPEMSDEELKELLSKYL